MHTCRFPTWIVLLLFAGFTHSYAMEEPPEIKKLRLTLQKKYAELPRFQANTELADVKFTKIDLAGSLTKIEGRNYYAFRFETPEEPADLVWAFRFDQGFQSWFIVPEQDEMEGFRSYDNRYLRREIPELGAPGTRFILQTLSHHHLKPESGYIIWVEVEEGSETEVTLSVNLLAPDSLLEPDSYGFYIRVFPMIYELN